MTLSYLKCNHAWLINHQNDDSLHHSLNIWSWLLCTLDNRQRILSTVILDHVKTSDKSAYTNEAYDVEGKGVDAKKISQRDKVMNGKSWNATILKLQMTMIESFKLRKKHADAGTQKAFSTEHLNEVRSIIRISAL